jgi:hypothetical protein
MKSITSTAQNTLESTITQNEIMDNITTTEPSDIFLNGQLDEFILG